MILLYWYFYYFISNKVTSLLPYWCAVVLTYNINSEILDVPSTQNYSRVQTANEHYYVNNIIMLITLLSLDTESGYWLDVKTRD